MSGDEIMSGDEDFDLTWLKAGNLPIEDSDLRHAANSPMAYDSKAARPHCDGMWKTSQLVGFVVAIGLAVAAIVVRPCKYYPLANEMLGITGLCGAFWAFEVMPLYATALLPVVLMPAFEITSAQNAALAYWQPLQLLVVGVFLVDVALTTAQLPKRITLRLLLSMDRFSPGLVLFSFMLITWTLSIFVNGIAVSLLVAPFAANLVRAAEEQTAVGGDFSGSEDSDDSEGGLQREVENLGHALMLGVAYSASVGGMATLTGSIEKAALMGIPGISEAVTYRRWMAFAFPISALGFLAIFAVLYLRYLRGSALKGATLDTLQREQEEFLEAVGPVSRDEVVVVLVGILQISMLFLRPWIGSLFHSPMGEEILGDATVAIFCGLLLFLIPSRSCPGRPVLTWRQVEENFNFGLLLLIGGGFAIASGFKESGLNMDLAQGLQGSKHEGACLGSPLVETVGVLAISVVGTQVLTSFASAATLLPAVHSAALNMVHNPLAFLLPATVGCSLAFMLPASAAPNIVALAKSQDFAKPLRTREFVLAGLPITVIMMGIAAMITFALSDPIFNAHGPFPKWACDDVSCLFVKVPGKVAGGVHVESQACAVDDFLNGTMCSLWNGTQLPTAPLLAAMGW